MRGSGRRLPTALVACLLLATGCIDDLLEAPYVLSTGLGEGARSLSPSPTRSFYVAGQGGLFEVDGEGRPRQLLRDPVQLAAAHLGFLAIFDTQAARFGPPPDADHPWTETSRATLAGVVDAQAWCDLQLLLIAGDQLVFLGPDDDAPRPWAPAPAGARALTLGSVTGTADPCAAALVLTPDRLLLVSPQGQQPLATGLVDARAVAIDRRGEPWVVHGQPPVLARIRDGRAETIARHVGDVADMHFGTGELLHHDNAYLLTRQGSLDYVRVPGGEG